MGNVENLEPSDSSGTFKFLVDRGRASLPSKGTKLPQHKTFQSLSLGQFSVRVRAVLSLAHFHLLIASRTSVRVRFQDSLQWESRRSSLGKAKI